MEPLISIGIPTYNRPDGLRSALNGITSQTYRNLEIVVSDNGSTDTATEQVVRTFMANDTRIRFFRQHENKGAAFNFDFVARQCTSDYFMFAADDDRWESTNLLEDLSRHVQNHTLTFPNCNLSSNNRVVERAHLDAYKDCATPMEYLLRWCGHGTGYPFYGLYNRRLMKEENISFAVDEDLKYYNEGTFLHRVFLNGRVKFVPNVYITFSVDSSKPNSEKLVVDFKKYFTRTLLLYGQSRLEETDKERIYSTIIDNYTRHLVSLQPEAYRGASLQHKMFKKMRALFF